MMTQEPIANMLGATWQCAATSYDRMPMTEVFTDLLTQVFVRSIK